MAERAYTSLRDRLIMLEIAPGEPINEGRIADELGFGRTPIREALKRLETDHLVVSYARRGTFATMVDIADLTEISEMRRQLEPLAARKAAKNHLELDREVFERLASDISNISEVVSGDDLDQLLAYDLQVHRLIYAAAGNKHLEETLVRLDNLATRIWRLVLGRLPEIAEHIREHVALLEAILDGRPDDAAAITQEHMKHFETTIRAAL
ncbi:GntR family transcriptional regulator [Citricoccus sp. GCM10030269]|uniref:GntR family transcriptional regulator n=1 Tax=Citricoccus sp. GCM10030269 TaxID=3273388 RepID=UPI003611B67C